MDIIPLKKKLDELNDIVLLTHDKFTKWVQALVLLSSGMLGVLCSMKTTKSETMALFWLYSLALCTLLLSILTGAVLMRCEIILLNRTRKLIQEQIGRLLSGKEAPPRLDFASLPTWTSPLTKFFYLALLTSLILLTVYAILRDI